MNGNIQSLCLIFDVKWRVSVFVWSPGGFMRNYVSIFNVAGVFIA